MKKNDKLPGHTWDSWEEVERFGATRFLYTCRRCGGKVMNAEPFSPSLLEKCGK